MGRNSNLIRQTTEEFRSRFQSIRVQLRADVLFSRQLDNGRMQTVTFYFHALPSLVNDSLDFDLDAAVANFNAQIEHFNSRGSSYNIEYITKFVIGIIAWQ